MYLKITENATYLQVIERVTRVIEVADVSLTRVIHKSTLTAAGQLLVGLGPSTPGALAAPTVDNKVLVSDVSEPAKMKWLALGGAAFSEDSEFDPAGAAAAVQAALDEHIEEGGTSLPNPTATGDVLTGAQVGGIWQWIKTTIDGLKTLLGLGSAAYQNTTAFDASGAAAAVISDAAYGAGWDGDTTHAPSKNALYDKIETLGTGTGSGGKAASKVWIYQNFM